MSEWYQDLPATWARVWDELEQGLADVSHPARYPAFASVGAAGAELRTLRLREVDRTAATVAFYTDLASDKVAELRASPMASVMIWCPASEFQVRLRVRTRIESGPDLEPIWAQLPDIARLPYGGTPAPGTPLAAPEDHTRTVSFDRFARIACSVEDVDTVSLAEPVHHRARFLRKCGFNGQWLAP